MEITLNNLTPIETYDNVLFKRDDLYMPYSDIPMSGGKVRQMIALVEHNYKHIKKERNSTIATASSLFSPQSVIAAKIAKEYGLKCIIAVGGGKTPEETIEKHGLIQASHELGAEIRVVSKLGYNTALYAKLNEMQRNEGFYNVGFGLASEERDSPILNCIADQVQNLPEDLDNLVIPAGSGIQMGAILVGLKRYNIKPKRIIGIQIAGHDRTKDIDTIVRNSGVVPFIGRLPKYEFLSDSTFAYHDFVNVAFDDMQLSAVYEAKAFKAMETLKLEGKTMFWVVGNENMVRELYCGKLRYVKNKEQKELVRVR